MQLSLSLDTSGLSDGVAQVQDAFSGLQPTLQQLNQAFDPAAAAGWATSVQQACATAGSAAAGAGQLIQTGLTSHLDPIGQGFARVFAGITSGGETAGQAFLRFGDQMLSRFVGWCAEMVERWAVKELTQTAATGAGAASRTATELSAQAAGMAASGVQALEDIGNSAARAAAGAYAAVAPTPIVGPELAPIAAATALAAVLGFGGAVASAEGGWGQVPYDGAMASLHKDEMVLPSSLATPLRSALGGAEAASSSARGGGSSATHHHWNIQALDAQSCPVRSLQPRRHHRRPHDGGAAAEPDAGAAGCTGDRPMSSSYPYLPMRWLVTTPDLADDPDVFPRLPGQGFLVEKTPVWSTTVRTAASGRQVRATQCSTPTWRFKVAYEFLRQRATNAELARLYGFFNTRQGQLGSFFYYDPIDNTVTDQPVAVANGTAVTYQLTRTVAAGSVSAYVEPVYVLNGAPSITVGGAAVSDFVVGDYGQITFATPPAEDAPIAWSGAYLFWCRFGQDELSPAQMVASLWSLDGLTFESVKP